REASVAHGGSLVVRTGEYTGRSPRDKFIVREPSSESNVWWSDVTQPMAEERFDKLRLRLLAYLQRRPLFVQDCFVGADPAYRVPTRVITETAWHSLFAHNLFTRPKPEELSAHRAELTVIHAPGFKANPRIDGTRSEVFIALHLRKRL